MSSAIKPPGTGPTSGAPSDVGGPKGAEGASDAFRAELDEAGSASEATSVGAAKGGARADALAALAEEVRSGRIDASQAIDRLVERALGGMAASLPPARRAELEAMLRAALEEDPTLAAMQRDLARGR